MTIVEAIITVVLIGGCVATGAAAAGVFYLLDVHRVKQHRADLHH